MGGNVNIVHNSLSVHPEGSKLAGVAVSNVSYGAAVTPTLKRKLADLRYLLVTPANNTSQSGRLSPAGTTLTPPNNRILTNQQLAQTGGTDVVLQWNGIEHKRGLVLVNNVINIQGVGPMTGPIILSNIRFPFRVPNTRPKVTVIPHVGAATAASSAAGVASPAATAAANTAGIAPSNAILLNDANNSGIVNGAQVSTGGFGDDGLQWNNVSIAGSVNIVHNQLSIDESSDLPPGDVPGPIVVSNVTFNSGALESGVSTKARAGRRFAPPFLPGCIDPQGEPRPAATQGPERPGRHDEQRHPQRRAGCLWGGQPRPASVAVCQGRRGRHGG